MVESVVDYEAWKKGYMPPSEHILIDELSHRGAKVALSISHPKLSFWFVVKGCELTKKRRAALLELLELTLDEFDEPKPDSHPLAAVYDLESQVDDLTPEDPSP